ncbi:MMPL family transporter [Nocardia mexicana]|uniref:RND superfamily putative drug exporter n=1 Tax=Nocardia mexicana TaxID=279262 RepID=A0A370GMH7_9NOCA|nr:MMPL family transporter [Nocardia mexicana]RDI44938.1 RND superfamily putative drug exporter [Nocardia mexicana]
MHSIARLATGWPRVVLLAALGIVVLCGAFGGTVQKDLRSGGFVTPEMESTQANQFMIDHFPGGNPNYIVQVHSDAGIVGNKAAEATGQRVVQQLQGFDEVVGTQSYWEVRPDLQLGMRSKDGKSALILASLSGDDSTAQDAAGKISEAISGSSDGVSVRAGGLAVSTYDINHKSAEDLIAAEAIAVPLSGLALVLVFGSVIAALLPVAIGLFSIVATLGILKICTLLTDVSIFAMNMASALGLALAIDYSLFIVSRFREETARGLDTRAATVRAIQTAGRTVAYSALTVIVSLAGLLVFQPFFFKSFAYAGISVVLTAAAAALVILPAALMLLGSRVNAWDLRVPLLRLFGRAPKSVAPQDSRWYRSVVATMRHPIAVSLGSVVVLLLLAAPFLSVNFGYPDDRALPDRVDSRQVGDALRDDFRANYAATVTIALPGYQGDRAALGEYAKELSAVDGVPVVLSSEGIYMGGNRTAAPPGEMSGPDGTYVSVSSSIDPYSREGAQQLSDLRAVPAPGQALFGGAAATNDDAGQALASRLPWAAAIIGLSTLIVLFLFTGSVVLPFKALVLNMFSLAATFGAMVWIFQDGHLSGLLDFTGAGYLNMAVPILMFCVAFGMSMDYEVFLLSRIREEWLAAPPEERSTVHSVAMGVARTGRIFTAAAGLMAIVFLCLATSSVVSTKLFAIGLALAVISDATIIRLLLVPALMRLMSRANWWSPKPLAALHKRIGLTESETETELAGVRS